jgi:hypothetical protein
MNSRQDEMVELVAQLTTPVNCGRGLRRRPSWRRVGELHGEAVFMDQDGRLALEKGFEQLVEMSVPDADSWLENLRRSAFTVVREDC